MSFEKELEQLINRHSVENASDTPDFILAKFIGGCLEAFATATQARDKWYGKAGPVFAQFNEVRDSNCSYCGHDESDHNKDGHCIRDHMGTGPNPCHCLEFEAEDDEIRL